ncbi:hypothetical protein CALVIDRAFT_565429 [Calocera viscosa TUFC12733]|uniref:Uncharacterized protein n=1 Tax=Calocera viscosa (strain TUFC12733) TaxID=1330018 RepID=A0A167KIK5_CALVF|nr:hypothetical protein CALVIDRAFT_565429 [Calocera viscosa TUFC12733]
MFPTARTKLAVVTDIPAVAPPPDLPRQNGTKTQSAASTVQKIALTTGSKLRAMRTARPAPDEEPPDDVKAKPETEPTNEEIDIPTSDGSMYGTPTGIKPMTEREGVEDALEPSLDEFQEAQKSKMRVKALISTDDLTHEDAKTVWIMTHSSHSPLHKDFNKKVEQEIQDRFQKDGYGDIESAVAYRWKRLGERHRTTLLSKTPSISGEGVTLTADNQRAVQESSSRTKDGPGWVAAAPTKPSEPSPQSEDFTEASTTATIVKRREDRLALSQSGSGELSELEIIRKIDELLSGRSSQNDGNAPVSTTSTTSKQPTVPEDSLQAKNRSNVVAGAQTKPSDVLRSIRNLQELKTEAAIERIWLFNRPPLPDIQPRLVLQEIFLPPQVLGKDAGLFEADADTLFQDNETLVHLGTEALRYALHRGARRAFPDIRHPGIIGIMNIFDSIEETVLPKLASAYRLDVKIPWVKARGPLASQPLAAVHADVFRAYIGAVSLHVDPHIQTRFLERLTTDFLEAAYPLAKKLAAEQAAKILAEEQAAKKLAAEQAAKKLAAKRSAKRLAAEKVARELIGMRIAKQLAANEAVKKLATAKAVSPISESESVAAAVANPPAQNQQSEGHAVNRRADMAQSYDVIRRIDDLLGIPRPPVVFHRRDDPVDSIVELTSSPSAEPSPDVASSAEPPPVIASSAETSPAVASSAEPSPAVASSVDPPPAATSSDPSHSKTALQMALLEAQHNVTPKHPPLQPRPGDDSAAGPAMPSYGTTGTSLSPERAWARSPLDRDPKTWPWPAVSGQFVPTNSSNASHASDSNTSTPASASTSGPLPRPVITRSTNPTTITGQVARIWGTVSRLMRR